MNQKILLSLFSFIVLTCGALLGVDFGQDYTKAALVAPAVNFELVLTAESKRKDLSGIAFKPSSDSNSNENSNPETNVERLYGSAAAPFSIRFPDQCLFNYKPLLGAPLNLNDNQIIDQYKKTHPFVNLIDSKNNRSTISFKHVNGAIFAVEEVFAMSLAEIKERSLDLWKSRLPGGRLPTGTNPIRDIAITIPPFAPISQRNAIKDSAEIAGLSLIGLVDDGVAVAVNYATNRQFSKDKQYHLIYDSGAASTTATLVSFRQEEDEKKGDPITIIEIEGVGYNTELNGELLTYNIFQIIKDKFLLKYSKNSENDIINNKRTFSKLWKESERVKTILSANQEVYSSIESLYDDIDFRTSITRNEFEEKSSNLIDLVNKPLIDALIPLNSNITKKFEINQLDSIILTGGSTRVPFVQKQLSLLVGDELISKNVNADEASVLGAAFRGVSISGMFKAKNIKVLERSLWNYDISYWNNKICNNIKNENDREICESKNKINIFQKGDLLDSIKSINLTELFNNTNKNDDDFTISLYENDKKFIQYESSGLIYSLGRIDLNSTACINSGLSYEAKFKLDKNKFFTLENIEARCPRPETKRGIFDILKKKKTDEDDDILVEEPIVTDTTTTKNETSSNTNSTSSSPSAPKPTKSILRSIIQTKNKHIGIKPMDATTKQKSKSRLRELTRKDNERHLIESTKNSLESYLYGFRSYLSSEEVEINVPSDILEQTTENVSGTLEWLDYESDGSSLKEINEKFDEMKLLRSKIHSIYKADTAYLKKLYETMEKDYFKLQRIIKKSSDDYSRLEKKFKKLGLDIKDVEKEAEIEGMKSPIESSKGMQVFLNISANMEDLRRALKDNSDSLSKEEGETLQEQTEDDINSMNLLGEELEEYTTEVVKTLKEKLSIATKLDKKRRKEAKLKQEAENKNGTSAEEQGQEHKENIEEHPEDIEEIYEDAKESLSEESPLEESSEKPTESKTPTHDEL